MPKFCNTKEEAAEVVKAMGESQFPCMIEVWTAHDVKSVHTNPDDQQLLNDEQAEEVLMNLVSDYSGSTGMNWSVIEQEANDRYPMCGDCDCLESDCDCTDLPDMHADTVGAAIGEADHPIKGWVAYWEFPGFVEWTHPDYNIRILATPWWECENKISIQIVDSEGETINEDTDLDIEFKHTGNTVDDTATYFKLMEANWGKIQEAIDELKPERCLECNKLSVPDSCEGMVCGQCTCK